MKILNLGHPKDVGFSYYDHLKFTWKESILALSMSLVMFIHGIFPPLFDLFINYKNHVVFKYYFIGSLYS